MSGDAAPPKEPEGMATLVGRVFAAMAGSRSLPASVAQAWRRVVGEKVAARSVPVRLRGRTLYVRVATSTWLTELQMLSPLIVERLRTEAGCGALQQIRLEVGPVEGRRPGPPSPSPPPRRATTPLTRAMERALAHVVDPDLRDRIGQTLAARRPPDEAG